MTNVFSSVEQDEIVNAARCEMCGCVPGIHTAECWAVLDARARDTTA